MYEYMTNQMFTLLYIIISWLSINMSPHVWYVEVFPRYQKCSVIEKNTSNKLLRNWHITVLHHNYMKLYIAVMKYISLKITSGISVLPYPLMILSHILFVRHLIYMVLKTIENLYDHSDMMISVQIYHFTKCSWSEFRMF